MKQSTQTKSIKAKILPLLLAVFSVQSHAFDLTGTVFEDAANAYGLDPTLIYAVALAESAKGKAGMVAPHPFTLRSKDGAFYGTKNEAEAELSRILNNNNKMVDVGLMQINIHWNGKGVEPLSLLDARTNVMHGAKILAQTIASSPNDLELGVGRYHHWNDVERSRNYGKRVLAIKRNLVAEANK